MTMAHRSQVWLVWGQEQDPPEPGPRPARRSLGQRRRGWLAEPKAAVWIILAGIAIVGGGRKLLASWNVRKAIIRLAEADVSPAEIEAAADHGRACVWELLRLYGSDEPEPKRFAAGRALARLWREDQLVAEEEQAIVRRGYRVDWHARRRYPRQLTAPIPITANYGVPFLRDDGRGVGPADLEWSHRVTGARRAALEQDSPWRPGTGRAEIAIIPGDFDSNGPHRLVLETRVRTRGLKSGWEIALPHMPFSFELTPLPTLDSILTLPDETRNQVIRQAVTLVSGDDTEGAGGPGVYLPLDPDFMLRLPPRIAVAVPLPCDLAHAIAIEFEEIEGLFPAGRVILSGQAPGPDHAAPVSVAQALFDLGAIDAPRGLIDRPGTSKIRAVLRPDPSIAWADPDVRSVWPGVIETNWVEVEIIRR